MPSLFIRDVPQALYDELLVAVAKSKPENAKTRPSLKDYVCRAVADRIAREKQPARKRRAA